MSNAELIASVREKAKGLEFDTRWLVLELAKRLESLRPKGEWVLEHETYGKMLCSQCEQEALVEEKPNPYDALGALTLFYVASNFCPNCGADMRGEE